jgi:hypothetical protein
MPKDPTKPFVRAPAQGPPRQHAYCCGCGKVLPSESIYGVVQLIDGDTRVLRPGSTARDASVRLDPLLPICATCAATLGEPWLWRVAPRPPRRIRIRRNAPWQVQPRAITCDRHGPYGNDFEVGVDGTPAECVALFIKKYDTIRPTGRASGRSWQARTWRAGVHSTSPVMRRCCCAGPMRRPPAPRSPWCPETSRPGPNSTLIPAPTSCARSAGRQPHPGPSAKPARLPCAGATADSSLIRLGHAPAPRARGSPSPRAKYTPGPPDVYNPGVRRP